MESFVYILTHVASGKFYIGSTSNVHKRIQRHFNELNNSKHHNVLLQECYNESKTLELRTLGPFKDRQSAYDFESKLITRALNDVKLLNILNGSIGGDAISRHPGLSSIREERRAKAVGIYSSLTADERKAKFGRPGKTNPMYGKSHTKEAKTKISLANLGRPSPAKGVPMSEDVRTKLIQALSKVDRRGANNTFYGRKHTEESKSKMGKANLGKSPPNCTAVVVENVEYKSYRAASEALGCHVTVVRHRCLSNNPLFSSWVIKWKCPETIETTLVNN